MQATAAALAALLAFALSAWAGAILFWSFAATPAMFKRLGRERAGQATRVVFPNYYAMGFLLATIALGALAGYTLAVGGWSVAAKLLFGVISLLFLLALYAKLVLIPTMERHRAGREAKDPEATRAWGRAHGLSVLLNLGSLALCLGGMALLAWMLAGA